MLTAALGLGLALPGAAGSASGDRRVVLEDIAFAPETVRVKRGARVTWVWRDGATPHDVRSRGRPRFRGTGARTQGRHTVRFTKQGTYRYVCTIHPLAMSGRVVVR